MIRITVGKKKFKGIYRWDEITLQKYSELAAIPMPDGYETFIIADGNFTSERIEEYVAAVEKLTDEQINVTFPAYYRKVISCLSNIPLRFKLSPEQVTDLYEFYFKPFVLSLTYHTPVIYFMGIIRDFEPEPVKSFRIGLRRFYLPESLELGGESIPLAREPIISYSEASDIFRGMKVGREDVSRLSLFMAIYCRGKGKKYNERKVLRRKELFNRVPMSIVWQVFFYTVRRLPDYTGIIRLFGKLPKSVKESVSAVRDYQSLAVGG